ncbi:tRNA glutamyl-Q(34) synthetase GluQRS [Gluconobacter kanchanaburiensis]|uniref:tRNA glutamyl-Q(34) synthetase GluQRS n=1 Tax=Gluconobacter kanchanaburiensis NBRC 103587 TaxID=1307948 RepID=A0A511B6I7_9PROT|nr:tRNA glutamyl-Q(34) synthetase GluQRS [Gluconobacter kanchanaburiensis]MBF0860658.1 tRNA glutamyl-Q(34) synthetase GluQRS [Gluconobacter kanchanaburiensis]GBR69555.1 glutamyl-tRNA synthetase [Gluconobacter kanchanaburiensis NBRC 103587]GEK96080.1 tRNA glutamyl-Q(34) synthetase GluQRS [Gluconobacter kanchanaburiensis NBRC 103587]
MTIPVTTRFAPSPTGFLHLGHVVSGRYSRIMAGDGGKFLIRIEDIDTTRCTPALTQALREDLEWLGLSSDGPVRQQSAHLAEYQAVLANLRERGVLYPCFCTRREIADAATQVAPDGSLVYPGICRHSVARKVQGRDPAWRLDMGRALDVLQDVPGWYEVGHGRVAGKADAFGDIVLARRDTGVSYHLCVTHDDALEGVTTVTRGRDLYEATSVQRVLQELMGWPELTYAHHALILDADGQKLSKRDGAEGVRVLRQEGWTARQVLDHPRVLQALEASAYSGG